VTADRSVTPAQQLPDAAATVTHAARRCCPPSGEDRVVEPGAATTSLPYRTFSIVVVERELLASITIGIGRQRKLVEAATRG
jgi:hypothetical protein